jgi:hypothetical protein
MHSFVHAFNPSLFACAKMLPNINSLHHFLHREIEADFIRQEQKHHQQHYNNSINYEKPQNISETIGLSHALKPS